MYRPEHISDVMQKHHSGCWYHFGGREQVYENMILEPVIWDNSINDTVPNPYEIPTKEFLESEFARLQSEYDSQDYARNRRNEYPSIEECVHAILDDQLDALQVKRQAVKAKYPK